jgi:type VI protein secretion system component Hcp
MTTTQLHTGITSYRGGRWCSAEGRRGAARAWAGLALAVTLVTASLRPSPAAAAVFVPYVDSGGSGMNNRNVGRITIANFNSGNAINVRSFRWGITSAGNPAAKPQFSDLSVVKVVDSVSPATMAAATTAQRFATVTLEVFTPGTTTVFATYTVENAVFTGLVNADAGRTSGGQPLEEMSLSFTRITVNVNGVSRCWNLPTGTQC